MDPGTPLPSESEEESSAKAATTAGVAEESAQHGQADSAVGSAESSGNGAGPVVGQTGATPAGTTNGALSTSDANKRPAVAITLELVMGDTVAATLQVLLKDGLDQATEQRLAACVPPDGTAIVAIAAGAHCTFAGHTDTLPGVKRRQSDGKVGDGSVDSPPDASASSDSSSAGVAHGRAGLLSAPREGAGLLLTLGAQPQLDVTHTVLGHVLLGKRGLRLLEALAPLSGGFGPRLPLSLRVVGPGGAQAASTGAKAEMAGSGVSAASAAEAAGEAAAGDAEDGKPEITNGKAKGGHAVIEHGFLLVESMATEMSNQPFALEASSPSSTAEVLEMAEVQINGRDAEITEMKGMPFNRERAEGVAVVEKSLIDLKSRLKELPDSEEALSHQSHWLQERVSHLLRILQKLK